MSSFVRRALVGTAMLFAVCPVLVAVAYQLVDGPPIANGDLALIAAASRNASRLAQTLGPYSRYGFAHPGPAMFYLFAPFVGASANVAPLYFVTGVTWAAVSAAFTREVAGGRAAPALAFLNAAVVVAFFCAFTRMHVLGFAAIQPWNPLIALAALFALVVASAALVRRARWAPVVFALAFVVAVQSHLTSVPIAIALVIASRRELALLARDAARAPRGRLEAIVALVLVVVSFVPVVYDALAHRGGNLASLVRVALHGAEGSKSYLDWPRIAFMVISPTAGVLDALGIRLDRFASGTNVLAALVVGLALVGAAVDRRAGHVRWQSLHRLTFAVLLGTVATLPMLRGHANAHPFYALAVLSVLIHVSALAPLVARVESSRIALAVLALAGASLVVHVERVTSERQADLATRWPNQRASAAVEHAARCLASHGPFAIRIVGKSAWGPAATAAWVGLAHGQRPRLDPSVRAVFGEAFTYGSISPSPGRPTLVVGTHPIDMRISRHTRPAVRLDVEVPIGQALARDSYAPRCLLAARERGAARATTGPR